MTFKPNINTSAIFIFSNGIKLLKKDRSIHQRCSVIKIVLRSFAKLTAKQLCKGLFCNKVAGMSPATLLKKRH